MKNKKWVLILVLIVIIVIAIVVVITRNQETKVNEIASENVIDTTNIKDFNTIDNEVQNNIQTSADEEISTDEIQTNTQTEETNNGSDNMNNEEIRVNLIVNNKTFSATLENNETTRKLIEMFPMTLNMSEMNSNEKYNYLDSNLPTNTTSPRTINAGDIKLYGNNCLVVFYKTFSTSYSYTNLGKVDNVNDFINELGRGNVNIRFELAE